MEEQLPSSAATLRVTPDSHHLFTTLLQSGVEVKSSNLMEMGAFLCQLPGFTPEYISNTVETIFLNGTPVDDLSQPFSGDNPTLALSAAMPGLAGAIFRKNSIHSALRTQTDTDKRLSKSAKSIVVTLKLFNTIAKGPGTDLLINGVSISSANVLNFFKRRSGLCDYITDIELGNEKITYMDFLHKIPQFQKIHLKVTHANG